MNKVILLVLLMPFPAFGQIIENFESGLSSAWIQSPNGHWNTDNANSISGTASLHHSFDNTVSGTDQIGIALSNFHPSEGNSLWSFKIRYGCEPSSSNNWVVWLMSDAGPDSMNDNTAPNGFAAGINLTGYDDTLRLWKVKDGIPSAVISTGINWQTDIGTTEAITISIGRSAAGQWNFTASRVNGGEIRSAEGYDPELFGQGWFVVSYKYTSTRDRLLWLDDVKIDGVFYEDNQAPVITNCQVTGRNRLLVSFDEEIPQTALIPSNFNIPAYGNKATRAAPVYARTCYIEFDKDFINKESNRLVISNLCDKLNNCSSETIVDFIPVWPDPGDVIISEIMADPVPAVSLPECEYFELFNRTKFPLNLKNWIITDGFQKWRLPEKSIYQGQYLIICSLKDTALFSKYGATLGLASFPTLTDGGKVLAVCDSTNNLIHGVEYSSNWYRDVLKENGGWSLEIIDADYPFNTLDNWRASEAREGGTPGRSNSVSQFNPDPLFEGLVNVFPSDSITVRIDLSETVFNLQAEKENVRINGSGLKELIPADPLLKRFTATPAEPLAARKTYVLALSSGVEDFAGNQARRNEFSIGLPRHAGEGGILFNELLFNPLPEGSDFIEFYNCSGNILNASDLLLASINDESGDTSGVCSLSREERCILPGDYYVVTEDRAYVINNFISASPDRIIEVPSLPSMPDDEGHLVLFNRELEKIDEVVYNEKMHYSLLQTYEGISLEKIRNTGMSRDLSLWHSASEACGWATPGMPNSMSGEQPAGGEAVKLSTTRITPDNDGIDDLLVIDLNPGGNGNVVSISIFDETGRFVNKLTDNLFASTGATVTWDGTGPDEKIVETGIYVLLITVFDNTGKVQKWKRVCAVVRR